MANRAKLFKTNNMFSINKMLKLRPYIMQKHYCFLPKKCEELLHSLQFLAKDIAAVDFMSTVQLNSPPLTSSGPGCSKHR